MGIRPCVRKRTIAKLNQRSEPAAAAAEAAPAAAGAARAGTVRAGPGFVDRQGPALEVLAVQAGDGLVGLFLVRHLDEAEAARLTGELVLDDRRALNRTEGLKGFLDVLLGGGPRNVSDVDVHLPLLYKCALALGPKPLV